MLQAASRGHVEVVSLLLRHGANLFHQNQEGETALHLACYHQHLTVCECLCEEASQRMVVSTSTTSSDQHQHAMKRNGLDVLFSLTNAQGETCLFYASRRGNVELVKYLIEVLIFRIYYILLIIVIMCM